MRRLLTQDDFKSYSVVAVPPGNTLHCWAGAPSAVYDPDSDKFYIIYRVRNPEKRGFEARIAESSDGVDFKTIKVFTNTEFNCPSIERSAIIKDPKTGKFKLYPSVDHAPWRILKLDDVDDPRDFDSATAKPVLEGIESGPTHVKDPFVMVDANGLYRMYYIGFRSSHEELFMATSKDGESWQPSDKNPLLTNYGWHTFFTRPACVVPLPAGYAFYYEGSNLDWFDRVYNVQTGLGLTDDLETIADLTPDAPALVSSTLSERVATLRYMDVVEAKGKAFVYYEAACKNESNELRVSVVED